MKTDHPIYLFLRSGPEAFRVLTDGRCLDGPYNVCSLTIKGIERRLDGLLEPDGHAGPAFVVEFQGQPQAKALYNLNTKSGKRCNRRRSMTTPAKCCQMSSSSGFSNASAAKPHRKFGPCSI